MGSGVFSSIFMDAEDALKWDFPVVSCQRGGSKCVKPDLCSGPNSIFFEKRYTLVEIVTFLGIRPNLIVID